MSDKLYPLLPFIYIVFSENIFPLVASKPFFPHLYCISYFGVLARKKKIV